MLLLAYKIFVKQNQIVSLKAQSTASHLIILVKKNHPVFVFCFITSIRDSKKVKIQGCSVSWSYRNAFESREGD